MGRHELNRMYRAILALSWAQRRELMDRLASVQAGDEARAVVEDRLQALRMCPHCQGLHVVRNGMARGLQRYKCRDCGRTFNTLTRTPLARLRYALALEDHGVDAAAREGMERDIEELDEIEPFEASTETDHETEVALADEIEGDDEAHFGVLCQPHGGIDAVLSLAETAWGWATEVAGSQQQKGPAR